MKGSETVRMGERAAWLEGVGLSCGGMPDDDVDMTAPTVEGEIV